MDCFAGVIATSNQYWREVLALFWEQALYCWCDWVQLGADWRDYYCFWLTPFFIVRVCYCWVLCRVDYCYCDDAATLFDPKFYNSFSPTQFIMIILLFLNWTLSVFLFFFLHLSVWKFQLNCLHFGDSSIWSLRQLISYQNLLRIQNYCYFHHQIELTVVVKASIGHGYCHLQWLISLKPLAASRPSL